MNVVGTCDNELIWGSGGVGRSGISSSNSQSSSVNPQPFTYNYLNQESYRSIAQVSDENA